MACVCAQEMKRSGRVTRLMAPLNAPLMFKGGSVKYRRVITTSWPPLPTCSVVSIVVRAIRSEPIFGGLAGDTVSPSCVNRIFFPFVLSFDLGFVGQCSHRSERLLRRAAPSETANLGPFKGV
jgi:hypothetical protein